MMMRRFFLTMFSLFCLFGGQAFANDKMTVLLDWFVNPDHGPLIIAQENGYFADVGLEVDIVAPADPSAPPKLVAAGQADIAISYQPQLHLQIAEGLPLVRVGTLVATPLNCLLALEDGPFESLGGEWRFDALSDEACRVSLDLTFQLRSGLLKMAASRLFESVANDMVDAMVRRANQLKKEKAS